MSRPRLGELLVHQGKVSAEQLRRALKMQAELGGRLGTNLLELDLIDEGTLLAALGEQRATRTATAAELRNAAPAVVKMIPAKLALRYRTVPCFLQGKTLFLASTDPGDALVEDEVRMLTGCMVRSCIALEVRVQEALERFYGAPQQVRQSALARRLSNSAASAAATAEAPAPAVTRPSLAPVMPLSSLSPPSPPIAAPAPAPIQAAAPVADVPLYIELDAEDEALLRRPAAAAALAGAAPAPPVSALPWQTAAASAPEAVAAAGEPSLEERLDQAARELLHAEIRDEIADALLAFCAPLFRRRLLLFRRQDRIIGWRGEGEGVVAAMLRGIEIQTSEPSIFLSVSPTGFWLGPLPPLPPNQNLVLGLGGARPKECVVLPITLLSKVVCYLYGDNLEQGVAGVPLAELRRLTAKAGVAFEVYILKNKIRVL